MNAVLPSRRDVTLAARVLPMAAIAILTAVQGAQRFLPVYSDFRNRSIEVMIIGIRIQGIYFF